jgi:acyl-CoA dehydrogenase
MNELQNMLHESVSRLFEDELDWDALTRYEKVESPDLLWSKLIEQGIDKVLASESSGGIEASWSDAYPVLRACGRYTVPLPVCETILGHWVAKQSGAELPKGIPGLLTDGFSVEADKFFLNRSIVPWGSRCNFYMAIHNSHLFILEAQNQQVENQNNLGRDPRDRISGEAKVLNQYPTSLNNDSFLYLGALVRSIQIGGASAAALDLALKYASDREQFGRSLAKFQAIQHHLADLAGLVASVDAIAIAACARLDLSGITQNERNARFEIAAAKCRASEAVEKITRLSHQIHGAIGFTYEYGLHFLTRRMWAWRTEYGGVAYWGEELGRLAVQQGGNEIWPIITA